MTITSNRNSLRFFYDKTADAPLWISLFVDFQVICVVTNGAMRFGCVVPFGTTHFFKEENPMKDKKGIGCAGVVSIILIIVLFVSFFGSCGKSSSGKKWSDLTEKEKDEARWAHQVQEAEEKYKQEHNRNQIQNYIYELG